MNHLLFLGKPFATISQFSQYDTKVEQLPAGERLKLEAAAEFVINSYKNPAAVGGLVSAVGLRGYSDQDVLKTGFARTQFEKKISEDRAAEVAKALTKAIRDKAHRLTGGLVPEGDPFQIEIEAMGATNLVKPHPANEYERSLNRRVEIFFLSDPSVISNLSDFPVPPQKSFKGVA